MPPAKVPECPFRRFELRRFGRTGTASDSANLGPAPTARTAARRMGSAPRSSDGPGPHNSVLDRMRSNSPAQSAIAESADHSIALPRKRIGTHRQGAFRAWHLTGGTWSLEWSRGGGGRAFARPWSCRPLEVFVIAVVLAVLLACPRVWGQQVEAKSDAETILLTNQRVLHGNVSHNGDLITIDLAEGGRISVPKNQVAFIGGSLREIYLHKLGTIRDTQPGDHYQLARWCLVEGLLEESILHYQRVSAVAGDHPRIRQLGVAIRQRILEDPEFRTYVGLDPRAPSPSQPGSQPYATTSAVQPASFPADSAAAEDADAAVADRRAAIEAALQNRGVALAFNQTIQPILLNRCSQAACHGPGSTTQWHLERPYRGHESEVTERNLRATLVFAVGSATPTDAPLLRRATQAHGTQRAPAISRAERYLIGQLEAWVRSAANPVVSAEASAATPLGTRLAPVSTEAVRLREVPRHPVSSPPPAGMPDVPSAAELDALEREIEREMARQSLSKTDPGSIDPFDPEAFNRMP